MTKLEKPAGIVVLTHPVHWPLAPQDVVDALTPDLLALPRESLAIDGVRFALDEGVQVDWDGVGRTTIEQMRAVRALLERHPGYVIAYFGGAPIPLALLAGFQVGTWAAVRVFQQRHRSKSWRWLEQSPLVEVPVPTGVPTQVIRARGDAVVCVQTSYGIVMQDVRDVVPHPIAEVVISTAPVDLDVLQTEADVEAVAKVFTEVLDQLGAKCPNLDYVHLIVAAPIGMTFRLGTCISATAHNRIKAYYYSRHTSPRYRCAFSLQELSAAAHADHVGAAHLPERGASPEQRRSVDIALGVAPARAVPAEGPFSNRRVPRPPVTETSPPTVFISYSHDSNAHGARVLALSERLRADGIPTILDRYVPGRSPAEGWPRWMMNALEAATFVLCVCTETYYRRFRGQEVPHKGKGVDWEGALITQTLYDARSVSNRFIPVLFDAADEAHVPDPLRPQTHYLLDSEASYEGLYDVLLGQAGIEPGPVGAPKRKDRATISPLTFATAAGAQVSSADPSVSRIIRHASEAARWAAPQAAVVTGASVTVTVATATRFTPRTLLERTRGLGSVGGSLVHQYPEVRADRIRWLDPVPAGGVLEIDLFGIVTYTRDATTVATLRKDAPDGAWGTEQQPGVSVFAILQSTLLALRLGEGLASPGAPSVSVALSGVEGRRLSFDELDARLRPGDRSWQYTFWNHDSRPCAIPTVRSKDVTASGLSRQEVALVLLEEVAPFFLFRVLSPTARHRDDMLNLFDAVDKL